MFQSEELENHLKTSDTIKTESAVYAEWNMNQPGNIKYLGNYRYRPTYSGSEYYLLPVSYDELDIGNWYTGATDSDVAIQSGFDDQDQPTLFISPKEKMKLLYSLNDCVSPHRPRSGINKPLYLGNIGSPYETAQYITNPSPINKVTDLQEVNQNYIVNRPRYYMSHKDDIFKYWTSYRTEYGVPSPRPGEAATSELRQVERGISFLVNGNNSIEDSVPFVVYENQVPANKIVVKMQTNVGDVDLGTLRYGNTSIQDPLFGNNNKTTPVRWRIEKLDEDNSWVTVISFDDVSLRADGTPIIGFDGHVEVSYGLQIPLEYRDIFIFADTIPNSTLLPDNAPEGYTYLVKESDHDLGTMYIFINEGWVPFTPDYSWAVSDELINYNSSFVTQPANPDYFYDVNNNPVFREFEWLSGIRIVVETMNKSGCTFDLIELSPRLLVEISDSVLSFSITKTMSDLGNGSIPVGGLSASIGQVEIFDTDFSFNQNNAFNFENYTGSILANYLDMPIKFLFYDITKEVNGIDYFIPVKTMYSESFPQVTGQAATVSITIRDLFFLLESRPAPELLLTDVSLSWAITVLLDYIGFSNYTFKRIAGHPETTIPYFFVEPNQNVAEMLQKLAVASQSAMFFDEYNNLVIMSKEYLLPNSEDERTTDTTMYGQVEGTNLPNIVNLSSQDKLVYNDGEINYTTRYIQRSIGSTATAQKIDQYKEYIYKPVLLWEVEGREATKTINQLGAQNSGYTLGAVPLNTNLTEELPYSLSNTVYNNVIDVGENVYWIPSYSGYFYANGEVIKFDAVEYSVSGEIEPVWITSNQEYQDYFSRLTFNGKMFPTGNVRIYTKPEYEIIDGITNLKNGQIIEHGRGQFGTPVTAHSAGLSSDSYWSDNLYVRGCIMDASRYLFTTGSYIEYPSTIQQGTAGKIQTSPYIDADAFSQSSTRNGIIKNFLADSYATELEVNYYKTTGPGTIQSSSLVVNGPKFTETLPASSFISYVYKDFIDQNGEAIPYKHFGTRMRIIGKVESGTDKSQTPVGGYPIFEGSPAYPDLPLTVVTQEADTKPLGSSPALSPSSPDQQVKIYGGSGGLGFGINKETNNGYFFEIVALTADNVGDYVSDNNAGIKVAKILSSPSPSCVANEVTVYTESQFDFQVGESVLISGLVDANDPTNTRTPLNGEYAITAIGTDKKSFKYVVVSSPALTTTSSTGGVALQSTQETTNIANMYFYKILSDNKKISPGYGKRVGDVVTLNFIKNNNTLSKDDKIILNNLGVNSSLIANGTYTITEASKGSISFINPGTAFNYNDTQWNFNELIIDVSLENPFAIPVKLWSGLSQINVDSGDFVGQNRLAGESSTTVYDLSAEYINIGSARRFFLYLNGKQISVVDDNDPLPEYNSMAVFTRGSSRCMFENVYALANNYSENTTFTVDSGISKVFGDETVDVSEALRKYAISGMIQNTYLSGISSAEPPKYRMYFEEFGTILREVAYFNVKYDRAYPALYAKLMNPMNRVKGYSVSGFYAGSYGADFLIFNCTDFNLNLDDTSGNYLRILGIAFTQDTTYKLTVDEYYKNRSILSSSDIGKSSTISNPFRILEEYNKIKNSRIKYGVHQFTPIDSPYIQSSDAAEDVFGWVIDKVSIPKKAVGMNTFGTTNLQLGDIVNINYKDAQGQGINIISPEETRFVIYNMEYRKDASGLSTTIYLLEV
jgi:hypothetical protein